MHHYAATFVIFILFVGAFSKRAELKDWFRGNFRFWTYLLFVILSVISVYLMNSFGRPCPEFVNKGLQTVIGSLLTVEWDFNDSDGNIGYQIEGASDEKFKSKVVERICSRKKLELEHNLNEDLWWRVRAGKLTEDGELQQVGWWSKVRKLGQYENSLMKIKKTKNINVYMSSSERQGFLFYRNGNSNGNDRGGFEYNLAKKFVSAYLPDKLGLKAGEIRMVTKEISWEPLLFSLKDGSADMIISSISVRPDREKTYSFKFSKPYLTVKMAIASREKLEGVGLTKAIGRKRVGYMGATTAREIARALDPMHKKNLVSTSDINDAFKNLESGDVDFVIGDSPFVAEGVHRALEVGKTVFWREFSNRDYPSSVPATSRSEPYAFAVRPGDDELLGFLNDSIRDLEASGGMADLILDAKKGYEAKYSITK